MNNDVIRINKTQKEEIEKLIPAMKKSYKNSPFGNLYSKQLDDRDYSAILDFLIIEASVTLGVELYKD